MRLQSFFVASFAVLLSAVAGVRDDFADPPPDSRLQAWYHWTTTGLSEKCIAADMKAMGEFGVGTAHVFMPNQLSLPPDVKPLSGKWWKLWEATIREAKKNGVRLGFHNCPGWTSSGGRWIKPKDSMKMLVSAETDVENLVNGIAVPKPEARHRFYSDVAVYAFPIDRPLVPVKVSGDFEADFDAFRHGKKSLGFPTGKNEPVRTLVFEADRPVSPSALVTRWSGSWLDLDMEVEASVDGTKWISLASRAYRTFNPYHHMMTPKVLKLRKCPPSRFFRIRVSPGRRRPVRLKLLSARFSSASFMDDVDERNGMTASFGYRETPDPEEPGLKRDAVLDISRCLKAGGMLDLSGVTVPRLPSNRWWRILRVGYTTTGMGCRPAPSNVRGLECDKLSKKGLDAHWPHMPRKMINAAGAKGTVAVAIIDSWEIHGQNWTRDFPAEFERRRGYSIRPWLPAMVGYTVGTAGATAKFLYDVQRTISDLVAENYFDYFAERCRREGVLSATESYGGPFDTLRAFRSVDMPTGEFWTGRPKMHYSPRLASSAGHLNGRRKIAAEAFTTDPPAGRWQVTPHELRVNGDRAWLEGISQFVFHSYVQQPHDNVQPGFSLLNHGTHLNRHTTWWPEGKWWARYVQRGQFILQSGKPKADVLVLSGDSTPKAPVYQDELVAAGYNYDFCGAADLHRLEARDGGVATPESLAYEVLCLGADRFLTCATLRRVKALLDAGVRVSGKRPLDTPTLSDDPAEWKRLVDAIWNGNYTNLREESSALAAVRAFGLRAPVESGGALSAARRVIEGRDFYFVMPAKGKSFRGAVSFAAKGRPERWDAKTGRIDPLPWLEDGPGRVKAAVSLPPDGSMFVSFRDPVAGERPLRGENDVPKAEEKVLLDISDRWAVTSFTGKNPPAAPRAFPVLTGWNESTDAKLRYFAGRAVYERNVELGNLSGPCVLDLGDVREIANVWVNGEFLGCLWEAPYRTALPASVSGKRVTLRVEVINTWPNRLIGDAIARKNGAAEPKGRNGIPKWVLDDRPDSGTGVYTWMSWLGGWSADDTPRPAGLLGPVRIVATSDPSAGE